MIKIRRVLPDVLAIILFVAISVSYFFTPIRDGLVLSGHDHSAPAGSSVEMNHYRETHHGERTRWTNSLFGGMPTYQMSPSYDSTDVLSVFEKVYQLGLPAVAAYVFMMLLGFYILLRAFDFRVWMAALGAVLWAFSSYYFIIIAAGHIWKLLTLSFIPPTIAGMVLCYKGRYLPGIIVTALFTALQILSNHVQMTYYFLFVMGFMLLAYLADAIKKHTLGRWTKATACFAVGGLLGIAINMSNLYHTWEYSKESMRGKSELTQKTKNPADQTSSGLERSYITMWSYGLGETWTLLVPNTKGGASMPLAASKTAMEHANANYSPIYQAFTQYWGEQPGTSGPVYVGAFVLMLFILGLFIVRGPMKWCLLAATILSILLSWGKNFMGFTDFFLDYVPMYDKFRTVASILVIAEFTIPLLAMLALKKLVEDPACLEGKSERWHFPRKHYLTLSFALTGGVALLFWLMPDLFFGDYLSSADQSYMRQYVEAGYIPQQLSADILRNMSDMRRAMFTADAMRSFIVVGVGALVLLAYRWKRIKEVPMVICLIILCLADMWGVNKRYLNDGMFSAPSARMQELQQTEADEMILAANQGAYNRVLNLTVSTFNDNTTSYYHKSIGGYHPAKLRRYQELIEEHIHQEMGRINRAIVDTRGELQECNGDSLFPVLNMLNTAWVILGTKDGHKMAVANPWAAGNAWYVPEVRYVQDADAEIASLREINPKHTAVANECFQDILGSSSEQDSTSFVVLKEYEANRLAYEATSTKGGVVVFSDIYYPGWSCTIDGKETPIARVNYVLRAIQVPAGKHSIVMSFYPKSVQVTETIAYIALALLVVLTLIYGLVSLRRSRRGQSA
ncbi:MAG: YfhO family protein [Paraprevotella sp.]|nr:YfhO family protein [Paraprevotella sp.]